jgi:hypothetical protein
VKQAAAVVEDLAVIEMSCTTPGAAIHYTTDLTDPDASSPRYSEPVPVAIQDLPVTVKARAIAAGHAHSRVVTRVIQRA